MNEHILSPDEYYMCRRCFEDICQLTFENNAGMCSTCYGERIKDLKTCDTCNQDERDNIGEIKGFEWSEDEDFKGQFFLRAIK